MENEKKVESIVSESVVEEKVSSTEPSIKKSDLKEENIKESLNNDNIKKDDSQKVKSEVIAEQSKPISQEVPLEKSKPISKDKEVKKTPNHQEYFKQDKITPPEKMPEKQPVSKNSSNTKIDYSKYPNYPTNQAKDLVFDPYEEDYISSTLLRWRVKNRGFKK